MNAFRSRLVTGAVVVMFTTAVSLYFASCSASQREVTAGRDADASIALARMDKLEASFAKLEQGMKTGDRHEATSQPVTVTGTGNATNQTRGEAAQQGGINLSYVVGGSAGLGLTLLARELFHKWMDDRQDARVGEATERMFQWLIVLLLELMKTQRAKP